MQWHQLIDDPESMNNGLLQWLESKLQWPGFPVEMEMGNSPGTSLITSKRTGVWDPGRVHQKELVAFYVQRIQSWDIKWCLVGLLACLLS